MSALTLYSYHRNSAGQRVRIVMNIKGLSYAYISAPALAAGEYQAVNPQGLMPALAVDGAVVAQSLAIIELLEELHPKPSIFPRDVLRRAQARSFAGLICSDLHPINNNRIRRYLERTIGASATQIQAWYQHWVAVTFASLEAMLVQRAQPWRFCFDDKPTVADACLVPQVDNARRFACDLAPYPTLVGIDAECRTLAAFQQAAGTNQPDFPGVGPGAGPGSGPGAP
jgi:maleylacetoacetate isomerase